MSIRKPEAHKSNPKVKKITLVALLLCSVVVAVSLIGCSDMITVLGTVELNFESHGGTHIEPQYLEKGAVKTDFPIPVLEGYTFAGWYRTKTFEGNPVTELKIISDKNIPLFAKWTVNSGTRYKVEHYQQNSNDDDYTLVSTDSKTGQTDTIATAVPNTYTGFTEKADHSSRVPSGTIAGNGSLVLKLYYDRTRHTLSFDSTPGSSVVPISNIKYGSTTTEPAIPSRTGYDFSGWYRESALLNLWAFSTDAVTEDTTLFAKWTAQTNTSYRVEHYQQNSEGNAYSLELTESKTGSTDTTATAVPKTYIGFTPNTSHTSYLPSGTIAGDGSLVLKLYYDWTYHTMNFDSNSGSAVGPISQIKYGTKATKPTNPTRAGYDFDGWYKEAGFTNSWNFSSDAVTENRTLYAKWTARNDTVYKVEHYQQNISDNGYTLESTVNKTGTTAATVTAATKTYIGFTPNTSHASYLPSGTIAGNGLLVLKLYYDRNRHTLSFVSNAGSSVGAIANIKYGAKATKPADPARTGNNFIGWYKDSGFSQTWNFSADTVKEDTTLYAKWTVQTFTVSFESNGGSSVSGYTAVPYDTTIAEPTAATKAGYTFDGWYKNAEFTNSWTFSSDAITENRTLYAKWTARNDTVYKVEHYQQNISDNGYTLESTVNKTGTTATNVTALAKTYTGFTENTGHGTRVPSGSISGDGSLVLKLYYDRTRHTLSFVSNSGSSVGSVSQIKYGATATKPADPTRDGYDFGGWHKDSGFTNLWNFSSDTVTGDTTLFARWTAHTDTVYTVEHYQQNISDDDYTLMVTDSKTGTTDTDTIAVASTYVGFTENTTYASRVPSGLISGDGSLVLKLYYDRTRHTLSFDSNSGSAIEAITDIKFGAKATKPTDPARTGNNFIGWYKDSGFTNLWDFSFDTVTGNTTLFAKWAVQTFTVSYNSDQGTSVGSTTGVLYGSTFAKPADPTKIGYTFAGWYKERAFENSWTFSSDAVTEDMTLYAKWTPRTDTPYTVYHYQEDVDVPYYAHVDSDSLTGTTAMNAIADAKTYTGFTENISHYGRVPSGIITGNGRLVLKLYYNRTRHTLSFDSNEGSSVEPITQIKYGAKVDAPTVPTKVGHDFGGWYKESALTNSWVFTKDTVKEDRTLYAKWIAQTFTVTFESNGGSSVSGYTAVPYDTTIAEPTAATKAGYTFDGWYKESGLVNSWNFSSDAVTENRILHAKWTARNDTVYKVEHYQQNIEGNAYSLVLTDSKTGPTDTTATAVPETYTGFSENTTHASRVPSGNIAGNGLLVLKLYYDRTRHTLSFESNEGSSVEPITQIKYGAKIDAPTVPTKVGHDFGGWYKESALTNSWVFTSDTVTEDRTLYAKWTVSTYAVSFASNEGSAVSSYTAVLYNTTIEAPAAPTRAGYDFDGWYKEAGFTNAWDFSFDKVTSPITLYAKWTGKSYTVQLDSQDGLGGSSSVSAIYGEAMPTAEAPARENYTFEGYFDTVGGGGTQYYTRSMNSASTWDKTSPSPTLYAYWERVKVVVVLDGNYANSGSSFVYATYGSPMPLVSLPTRTGYKFNGYYADSNGVGAKYYNADGTSAKDWDIQTTNMVRLYANWTPGTYTVTFDPQEGGGGTTAVTATYGSVMPSATAPTKSGYVFDGYYASGNGSGTKYYDKNMLPTSNWDQGYNTTIFAKWREFEVGDTCPAGGYIFYKKTYKTEGWQYLSAAPKGWYGGSSDPKMMWGGYNTATGATGTDFGSGLSNTNAIVTKVGTGTYAAKACADYSVTVNGTVYKDWYLPADQELKRLAHYYYRSVEAKLDSDYYWSSTEQNAERAYIYYTGGTGSPAPTSKENINKRSVRPIRRF